MHGRGAWWNASAAAASLRPRSSAGAMDGLEKRVSELELFVHSGAQVRPSSLVFHDGDRPPTTSLPVLVRRSGCSLHHHPTQQHSALLLPGVGKPPWLRRGWEGPIGPHAKVMGLPRAVDLVEGRWPPEGDEPPSPETNGRDSPPG